MTYYYYSTHYILSIFFSNYISKTNSVTDLETNRQTNTKWQGLVNDGPCQYNFVCKNEDDLYFSSVKLTIFTNDIISMKLPFTIQTRMLFLSCSSVSPTIFFICWHLSNFILLEVKLSISESRERNFTSSFSFPKFLNLFSLFRVAFSLTIWWMISG